MLYNTENIVLRSLQILYIFVFREEKGYHVCDSFSSKMVTFSSRNTNIYKFANFTRLYFPSFTTFRH